MRSAECRGAPVSSCMVECGCMKVVVAMAEASGAEQSVGESCTALP